MIKRFIFNLFLLLIVTNLGFAASVNVTSDVSLNEAIFTYNFKFNENESYSSFSFEKTKNSQIVQAINTITNKQIDYSVAGDYFIFKPNEITNQSFKIVYKSNSLIEEIYQKDSYSVYVNFNIPIENLKFQVNFKDMLGTISEVFPRDYLQNENNYFWELEKLEKDTLFMIKFDSFINKEIIISENKKENVWYKDKYFILMLIFTVSIVLILIIFGRKLLISVNKENKKKEEKNKIEENKKEEIKNSNSEKETITDEETKEDKKTYDEFIEKYLTDNEKEVVELIKNHQGISQYDILNHIPTLSKSNLSKIISKLHVRKILNRIKVGKINKIYFGEKLELFTENKKKE